MRNRANRERGGDPRDVIRAGDVAGVGPDISGPDFSGPDSSGPDTGGTDDAGFGDAGGCAADVDCDDGQWCNGSEGCIVGQCIPGWDACSVGQVCDEDQDDCYAPCTADEDCDDGLWCNGAEARQTGRCVGGPQACPAGQVCDEANDACATPCATAVDCDDGDPCTGYTCVDGACRGPVDPCDDGEPCTTDTCDPFWGCSSDWSENWTPCAEGYCWGGRCIATPTCDDGNVVEWDGCTRGYVTEFLVNSHLTGHQYDAEVGAAPDGRFTVTWTSEGIDGYWYGVAVRSFAADGTPLVADQAANTHVELDQENPAVSVWADGTAVVVWRGFDVATNEEAWHRAVDAEGLPLGGDVLLRPADGWYSPWGPRVDHVDAATIWTVWDIDNGEGRFGVECAVGPVGQTSSARTLIYDAAPDFVQPHDPDVAALPDGGAVVVWSADTGVGTGHDVWFQLMTADGETFGGSVRANAAAAGGQFVPRVAALGEHGFVVVREADGGQDGSGLGIFGRRFTLGGQPVTDDFVVNEETAQDQRWPTVAGWSDGAFVVSYAGLEEGGGYRDVFVRRFSDAGVPLAGATRANLFTTMSQDVPSVATYTEGFVVVWTSPAQAPPYDQYNEIYGQRFDRDGVRRYR